jgi:hypothetical protein
MKETYARIECLLEKKYMLRKTPVEHMCRPKSFGIADWAVRRLYEILLLSV